MHICQQPTLVPGSQSSSIPPIPPSVRLPIIVGPLPSSVDSSANNGEPKPIVLHQNTLILNPTIFSHLAPQQLRDLEALGAQKALEILQGYIVRFYKEKLRAEGARGRGRGRGKRTRGAAPGLSRPVASSDGLFTTTPLPVRTPQPELQASESTSTPTISGESTATIPSTEPPMASLQPPNDRAESPVIIIDDDDEGSDAHISKRPRLEGEDEASP